VLQRAGLAPLTGFYLQRAHLEPLPFLAVFPLCCLQFGMLLAIEFPDAAGDRAAGKRTLVVRLGGRQAARLYLGALALAYASPPTLVLAGLPALPALAVLLTFPLALAQARAVLRGDTRNPARWNSLAFRAVALLIATAAVEAFAFVLLIGM
jgi:1,4-dihydroxy-2-naphthoate octaprenyltransferase